MDIFVKNESIYVQSRQKMIRGQFYKYRRIHFTSRNASFCDNNL